MFDICGINTGIYGIPQLKNLLLSVYNLVNWPNTLKLNRAYEGFDEHVNKY